MTTTVAEALGGGRSRLAAAGIPSAALDAQLLLENAAGLDRAALFARSREPLPRPAAERYERLLAARSRRVPLAYVTGEREFWSLRLRVDGRVLVPRPETETLVEAALERLRPGGAVADVGTGSGAVVIALAAELGAGQFHAIDRCGAALAVARANADAHGLGASIAFHEGDLLSPLAEAGVQVDAVVANLPYIPTGDLEGLEREVREHEPRGALDGGPDGLSAIGRLVATAPPVLRPGAWLLLEVGAGQAPAVRSLLEGGGAYAAVDTRRDLAGIERVVLARRAA